MITVHESKWVTKPVYRYRDRTWRERLFSRPWKPWEPWALECYYEPAAIAVPGSGVIYAHPAIAQQIRAANFLKEKTNHAG